MSYDEYAAIFKMAEEGHRWRQAHAAVAKVSGLERDPKTIRGVLKLAKKLLGQDLDEVRRLDSSTAMSIAKEVGYGMNGVRVSGIVTEFLMWKGAIPLTRQGATDGHHEDLLKLADSLRYNLTVPTPEQARFIASEMPELSEDSAEALTVEAQAMRRMFLPGPKTVMADGNIDVVFFAEDSPLFPGFIEHLKEVDLEEPFWELKSLLRLHAELCLGKQPSEPQALRKVRSNVTALIETLKIGMETILLKRDVPGQCRFCS